MRGRRIRLTMGIIGGLLAVLVLVAVLLPLLVPREKLRSMAESQLREQTGGEVALGPLSLKVFPRLRLVLGESSLAVTGAGLRAAGQQPGPLVSGDLALTRLEVDLALWPLLSKQLEFGEVSLIEPRLRLVTAPADAAAAAPETGGPEAAASGSSPVDPGVGLALAAVSVRDGELAWSEEGTGRGVTVSGWQQQLEAPQLGTLLTRLQQLGGGDAPGSAPSDAVPGEVALSLEARVASVELSGFGEQPLPAFRDITLRGGIAAPAGAERLNFTIEELSSAPLRVTAHGSVDAATVTVDALELAAGEAVSLAGTARLADLAAPGAVSADLGGKVDLARVLDELAPLLPPRPQDAPPLPTVTGELELNLVASLQQAPALSDAAAWQEAWRAGLQGTATLDARGGPLRVEDARLAEALTVARVAVSSDLRSAGGRTHLALTGASYPGVQADAEAELVLPPATGPLQATATGDLDLAPFMAAMEAFLPPRAEGAAPLPELAGRVKAELDLDLATAPALDDTAAWAAAYRTGLDGRARVTASGSSLTASAPQLGEPLRIDQFDLRGDLRSPRGLTQLTLGGVQHPVLQGDCEVRLEPGLGEGPVQVGLQLPLLDLDAMAELARKAAVGQASGAPDRGGFSLVSTARAATATAPQVGELIPPELAVDLEASVRELRFLETPYTQLELQGTLRQRVIDVTRLQARLGEGRVQGTARVDYAADPGGRAAWNVQVSGAPASVLMQPYLGDLARYWEGAVDATATGSCALADPEAVMNTLSIEGDLEATRGVIDLREPLAGVEQYLGDRRDLLRVVYSAADQDYVVRDGMVVINSMRIDGKDTDWLGSGTIGLDGRLDLDLSVRLPAGYTPDLGDVTFLADALRDEQGRIGLDFALTGPTAKPAVKLKLDPAELMKSNAVQDKVEDEVKKGLGGLLDRLKGK